MNKNIKRALLFMSGATVGCVFGSVVIIGKALENEHIRNAIKNSVSDKIDEVLYGRDCRDYRNYNRCRNRRSKVSYVSYYRDHKIPSIDFLTEADAQEVLNSMKEIVGKYGVITVADMYDLCDMPSNYTDNMYGWTNLEKAEITENRNAYTIKLPKVLPL